MSELRIQITRRADGGAVLRCERADGSVTWQKQAGKNAAFFPLQISPSTGAQERTNDRRA